MDFVDLVLLHSVLGIKQDIEINDIDIRGYAKFILKDGEVEEKRELLSCFKSNPSTEK